MSVLVVSVPPDPRIPSAQALLDRASDLAAFFVGDDCVDINIEVREEDATDIIRVRVESRFSEDEESWSIARAAIVSQWGGGVGIFDVKTRTWGVKSPRRGFVWLEPGVLLEEVRSLVEGILGDSP